MSQLSKEQVEELRGRLVRSLGVSKKDNVPVVIMADNIMHMFNESLPLDTTRSEELSPITIPNEDSENFAHKEGKDNKDAKSMKDTTDYSSISNPTLKYVLESCATEEEEAQLNAKLRTPKDSTKKTAKISSETDLHNKVLDRLLEATKSRELYTITAYELVSMIRAHDMEEAGRNMLKASMAKDETSPYTPGKMVPVTKEEYENRIVEGNKILPEPFTKTPSGTGKLSRTKEFDRFKAIETQILNLQRQVNSCTDTQSSSQQGVRPSKVVEAAYAKFLEVEAGLQLQERVNEHYTPARKKKVALDSAAIRKLLDGSRYCCAEDSAMYNIIEAVNLIASHLEEN